MSPFISPPIDSTIGPQEPDASFENYLARWKLIPDGPPIKTPGSCLLPVLVDDKTLGMLKISRHPEEQQGGKLMAWWNGEGATRVLAHENAALLLERATGSRSLAEMSRTESDDHASRILCAVAARLHAIKHPSPPKLTPLTGWFRELEPVALNRDGVLRESLRVSRHLLATPQDTVILHGDLHHGNVLDAGSRGWLAVDPKGLIGERGFEFANIFCNPDKKTATAPGRLAKQATIVSEAARLDSRRLLQWILAYAGLSAAWSLNSGENADIALTVAQQAAYELADL